MPPKKAEGKPKKVAEDKTFGMKNKKGGKGQKAVQLAAQQQAQIGRNKEAVAKEKAKEDKAKQKAAEQKHKAELEELFKPAQVAQKVPFGVDPKTVLCTNFKNGVCDRGAKCKFSHDLNVGRKVDKADIYTDARADDTMDKWDDAKLKSVVLSKHGNAKTTTDIVCKFFIDAIEESKYGYFWTCPNGDDCKYVHALPPGFVLKSQKKKDDDNVQSISLEEFLETERHKLGPNLTPVTPESFAKWKQTRLDAKSASEDAERKAKAATANANKAAGLSGRDMFTFNPLLMDDSDESEDEDWDFAALRRAAEDEREAAERARIEALGGSVGSMSIQS